MTYVITEPCKGVKDAACVSVYPINAIYFEDDIPTEWQHYLALNANYFSAART